MLLKAIHELQHVVSEMELEEPGCQIIRRLTWSLPIPSK